MDEWETRVTKRTRVIFLGDVVFDRDLIEPFKKLRGEKVLVAGNHDHEKLKTRDLAEMFIEIYGITKYKKFWLSHAPIHPYELRGSMNVHGHVHDKTILKYPRCWPMANPADLNYINISQDVIYKETGSIFVSLDQLREIAAIRKRK